MGKRALSVALDTGHSEKTSQRMQSVSSESLWGWLSIVMAEDTFKMHGHRRVHPLSWQRTHSRWIGHQLMLEEQVVAWSYCTNFVTVEVQITCANEWGSTMNQWGSMVEKVTALVSTFCWYRSYSALRPLPLSEMVPLTPMGVNYPLMRRVNEFPDYNSFLILSSQTLDIEYAP